MRRNSLHHGILIATMVLALPLTAIAGENFARRGVAELGGTIGFSSTSIVDSPADAFNVFQFEPSVGYFVTDGLEIGARPIGITVTSAGDNTVTQVFTLASLAYNFATGSSAYPFLEGLVGFSSLSGSLSFNDASESGVAWGGRGGVKVAIAEHALLNLAIGYTRETYGENGLGVLAVLAGFSVWVP